MKAIVNEGCIGCGLCASTCPAVFTLEDGVAVAMAGDIPEEELGGDAVLLGAQGDERITPDELAALAGTIPYEIMLGFGNRFVREVK